MAVQQILTLPNPILRQQARPITAINQKVLGVLKNLKETLAAAEKPKGVGLAAPQIGQSLRIILIWSSGSRRFLPMINPEIIWHSSRTRLGISNSKKSLPAGPLRRALRRRWREASRQAYEGCLSVPGVWGKVRRFSVIKVRWQTPSGQQVIRRFRGFTGVVIQHEIDHLEGILFIDRILQQGGKIYQVEKNEKNQMVFQEIKLVNEFLNKQPEI